MQRYVLRLGGLLVLPALLCLAMPGCGAMGNSLPADVTVTLPDGTTETVTLGAGVDSLADTEWDFFYVAGNAQGMPFVRIRFGPEGALEAFEDNRIAGEIFGATILFDGVQHETTQPGLQYAAATYGAETSDAMGFTFQGHLKAFAAGIEVASAVATATAEFDPKDPDVVYGEFDFTAELSSIAASFVTIPEEELSQSFSFMGQRVIEE